MAKNKNLLPFIIGALGGGLGGKFAAGLGTKNAADELSKKSTDEWRKKVGASNYTTPEAYGEFKSYQKDLLGLSGREQMPGYSQAKQEIEGTTAAGLGSIGQLAEGASGMAGLLGLQQQRQSALRNLGIQASQYQSQQQNQARQNYGQAIGMGAQYEDKAFDYNQWVPWQMKMNEQMRGRNVGNQQMSGAIDQAMAFGLQGSNMAATQQMGGGNQQWGGPQGMNQGWGGPQYNSSQNSWGQSNNNQYPNNFATGQYGSPQQGPQYNWATGQWE